jgi:tRNA1Val (adenine37-N6)-methyltransferase
MANTFFRFKQFTVEQEHCAMKVCTDACLFGAWIASVTQHTTSPIHKILDIGSGTGLLSLMAAQENPNALIDAIEIDPDAATQSQQNFQGSPWKERLTSIQGDVKQIVLPAKYDLIISNPPFFENDLKSDAAKRNLALHSDALSLEELLTAIKNNLTDAGRFAVLLPYHRSAAFEEMAIGEKFYPEEKVLVKQTPKHPYFRSMLLFSTQQSGTIEKEMVIKDEFNDYSKAFIQLLKNYYLFL